MTATNTTGREGKHQHQKANVMNKRSYVVTVKGHVTGYFELLVEATSEEEARNRAEGHDWEGYRQTLECELSVDDIVCAEEMNPEELRTWRRWEKLDEDALMVALGREGALDDSALGRNPS